MTVFHPALGKLDMKYVMIRASIRDTEDCIFPVIFPRLMAHNLMMEGVRASQYMGNIPITEIEAISAGFFTLMPCSSYVHVYGYSESLKLKPLPGDGDIIYKYLVDSKP
jgi:hypothetical protein